MASSIHKKNILVNASATLKRIVLPAILLLYNANVIFSQTKDSIAILKNIKISAVKKQNDFTNTAPVQSLNKETLQQINAQSAGDAARYFSGVLVKDYG